MKKIQNKAFTLVELIVVVTILAILATIGFVSYSSYLIGVRDTNRIAQMTSLSDGLNLYSTTNDLPIPEDNVEVSVGNTLIAYQGYAGANILETINFDKGGLDPKDNSYFSYYLTRDRKFFQMMGFLEESSDLTTTISPSPGRGGLGRGVANAVNFQDRIPTVTGKKLGILTDKDNTPIQDVGSDINLETDDTTNYIAHLSNDSKMTGDVAGSSSLVYLEGVVNAGGVASSCKTLIDRRKSLTGKDGVYIIDPEGGKPFPVYCDMTSDGGGWMLVANTQTDLVAITSSSYENGVGQPDFENLNNGTWIVDVDAYDKVGSTMRINMGEVTDYFQPTQGNSIKDMIVGLSKHMWSNSYDGIFITPDYAGSFLGGSLVNYPLNNIENDSRQYLSFWGGTATGGCCHNTYSSGAVWSQPFQMWIK